MITPDDDQPLLRALRESGAALEASTPDFDRDSAAAWIRRVAEARGLLVPDSILEDDLAATGQGLEDNSPPFEVAANAAAIRAAAHNLESPSLQEVNITGDRQGHTNTLDTLGEYSHAIVWLPELGATLHALMVRLLAAENIQVHRVEYRVKSKASVERKAARIADIGRGQPPLDSITDLLGLRIITYFRDEVDQVARLIEREFVVDYENSTDKRATLDPDRFGYLSQHYVVQLSPTRIALPEYQRYGGIKFELQIRSILQHAWAEIERDFGYKSEAAFPRRLRRRFSRLAAVVELADDEFAEMRREIGVHRSVAVESIQQWALNMEIDSDSLAAFVEESEEVKKLSDKIAQQMNSTVQAEVDYDFISRQADQLLALGFNSIEELKTYIDVNYEILDRFIEERRLSPGSRMVRSPVPVGVALHYVGLLKSARGNISKQ
jgi:ppGpp synthetase/RelA/SpoT-type nucleotidyltranferase